MSENFSEQIPNEEGTILEITQEQYDDALARGLTSDETLPPGRHRFVRGGFLKRMGITREELAAATIQISVKLPLDDDVFNHFKQRAADSGAESFQTYINQALRRAMESEREAGDALAPVKQQLLADRQFIGAVAAQIAAQAELRQPA